MRNRSNAWWLIASCGVGEAICAAMNLLTLNLDGWPVLRRFALPNTVWDMSMVALLAGICAIAAGLWNLGRNRAWMLSLHGLALGSFGFIGVSPLVKGPLSFRPISLLLVLMVVSLGAFAWATARTLRSGVPGKLFLKVSEAASMGFALSFVAVGFGWLRLGPPHSFWIWMSSYFGFCAIVMLWLALRVRGRGIPESGPIDVLPQFGSPRHP
jgi:hypothetical protein